MTKAQRAERERKAKHAAAARAWGELDPRTVKRTGILIAASLLSGAGEDELAEWLLLARPEHAQAVATGVAVHALRRCHPAAWDALVVCDVIDGGQADDWYFADACFEWAPDAEMLVSEDVAEPPQAPAAAFNAA